MLFFADGEDHGWEYRLFRDGAKVATVSVNYEMDFGMILDLAEKRYPEINDPIHDLGNRWGELRNEVENSQQYKRRQEQQFANANVHEFHVFGFDDITIRRLEEILKLEWYKDHYRKQVDEFKKTVNIVDMSWTSYHYAMKDDEEA